MIIDDTILGLVIAAAAITAVLFVVMRYMPHSSGLNREQYQSKWLEIERQLDMTNSSSRYMAILNADKLLDQALKDSGARGDTMGQRLKARQGAWSNANAVWSAHKMRNQIAHEEQVTLNETSVRRSLASFKQALKDLGAM